MKICYIASGVSIHTQRWINYFAQRGHEVHLISYRFSTNYDGFETGVHIHPLIVLLPGVWKISRYLSGIFWLFQVRRMLSKIKPDILHSHYVTTYGYLGAISCFHPLILSAWGSDVLIAPKKSRIHRFLTAYALKKADILVCLFPIDVAKEQFTELGVDSNKIRSLLLGVNTAEFNPSRRDEKIRRTLGIESSQPIVISTRTLAPIYNVETLVKAIPLVLTEIPQVEFVITGIGEQQSYLRELARDLGVSNTTNFVGWVPRTEFIKYLSSADIYVSSSLSDGASISLFEAMACELPPVVTDIPANRPWVSDGKNGFLFPVRDHKTLASKIIYLLNNKETREDFGRRSREIVQKKAEQQTEMKKLERLYHRLVEASSILRM